MLLNPSVSDREVYRVPLRAECNVCRSAAHVLVLSYFVARSPSLPLTCQNRARENSAAPFGTFLAFLASSLQSPYLLLLPAFSVLSLPSSPSQRFLPSKRGKRVKRG